MFVLVALKRAGLLVIAELVNLSLGGLLGLLGEEDDLDVGEDTALGDGHTGKQLVQLLVVTERQAHVKPFSCRFLAGWSFGPFS